MREDVKLELVYGKSYPIWLRAKPVAAGKMSDFVSAINEQR
jgi:hypothetical protein